MDENPVNQALGTATVFRVETTAQQQTVLTSAGTQPSSDLE